MDRRKFIGHASVGLAGLWSLPALASGEKEVFGHNDKKYRIDTKWSRADVARYPVNDCHEMVQDSKGRIILLTNETRNNVLVYDRSGKILTSWGTSYPGAHGLTLFNENGKDVLFICDNNRHQVIKTTIDGKELMVLDYPRESGVYEKAEEYVPTETAIAPNGDIYVADGYGKDYIIQYDSRGKYIRHFGGRGQQDRQLVNAHGVCIDSRNGEPVLMVTSRMQNAFKRFKLNGDYIDTIALPGAWVCRPVVHGNYLYAAVLQSESLQGKQSGFITILDKNNKVISNPGGTQPEYESGKLKAMTQEEKIFQYPHDVCVDNDENLYVAQWNSGKVYPYKLTPVT
ncbi:MAG TPA: 6-bladed beta-propeller [Sphingobacteriaceae bacterium]